MFGGNHGILKPSPDPQIEITKEKKQAERVNRLKAITLHPSLISLLPKCCLQIIMPVHGWKLPSLPPNVFPPYS